MSERDILVEKILNLIHEDEKKLEIALEFLGLSKEVNEADTVNY